MNDADRRRAFEAWFAGPPCNGDREALIKKTGYTKGRISQFFDPAQQFGERAARSLAKRLGLKEEVFNTPNQLTEATQPVGDEAQGIAWPFQMVAIERWERLGEREKGAVERAMLDELERIEATQHQANGTNG